MFTKESVEAIPFGELSLSVFGDSSWDEDTRCQKLSSAITELLEYVDGLGKYGYKPLRLVRVTADFADEVASWQRQLAHPEILSQGCVGKMFVWGDGTMQSTYAVIIVPEKLAANLIEGNDRKKTTAKGILVHEIIHIHDECEMLRDFGPRAMPMSNNWPGIRRDIAKGIWTEFSADHVAYNWLKDYFSEKQVQPAADTLKTALEEINQKIVEYREHGDIGTLWESAGSKLSQTFNQIGRAAGLLTAAQKDDNDQFDPFFKSVTEVSTEWGKLVRQLVTELNILLSQNRRDSADFNRLEEIVEKGFLASGLRPIVDKQGLRVEIVDLLLD